MKDPTMRLRAALLLFATVLLLVAGGCHHAAVDRPQGLAIAFDPQLDFYPVSSDITPTATVTDAAGKPLPMEKVTWTVSPEGAAVPSNMTDGAFTLMTPGPLTFTACTVDPATDGMLKCGQGDIVVAPPPPVVTLTKPAPGAEVGGDGKSTFTVEGTVMSSLTAQMFVDGQPAMVGQDGSFSADVPAYFGINHLVVSAYDGENPEVRNELDVAFGGAYAPAVDATGAPAFSSPDAVVLDLGQGFFDDGSTVPLNAPHPVTLPDIANIVSRLVAGLDVLSKIPNPILASNNANLTATSVTLGDVNVEVSLVSDGLDLYVRVGKLSVGTMGSLQISNTTVSLDGGVNAAVSAYAHASITKASPTTPVIVKMDPPTVVLETASGNFTDPQANAIFTLGSGFLRQTVQQKLEDAVGAALQSTVPQGLESIFQSLDSALANKSISINSSPLPMVGLTLDGHLHSLDIKAEDSLRAKLSLAVKTDHTMATHPESRGIALVDTNTTDALFDSPRSQLSVRLSVLNGLLHNLWNSGLLEIPVSGSIPLSVSAKLPPIVRLPRDGETDDLVVSVGELELVPSGDDANGRLGVLIEAGMNIDLANNTLAVTLADQPTVKVWTITPPQGMTLFTPDVISSLLKTALWPKLRDGVQSALAIKLPLPPLDALATLAPSLAGLKLTTGMNRRLSYRDGFLVLDAKLEATLP